MPDGSDEWGHHSVWTLETLSRMINWVRSTRGVHWGWVAVEEIDSKVGNGLTVLLQKMGNRSQIGMNEDHSVPQLNHALETSPTT